MAEKLGISTNTLRTYNTPSRLNLDSTTSDWIKDNIKKIRTIKDGKSVNLYKDLTKTDLKIGHHYKNPQRYRLRWWTILKSMMKYLEIK